MELRLGDFKQEIMKLHNKVNLNLFGQGLRWQKVEVVEDKVFIIANNKRVKALTEIDQKDNMTTKLMDVALLIEFKGRFKKLLKEELDITALAVLKDYDPNTEITICTVILDEKLEDILSRSK